jgi:hypothetical protein
MNDPTTPVPVEEIERRLHENLQGQAKHLRVVWRHDQVVLQGRTHSYYIKQLAQVVVLKALGNILLVNEIEVQPLVQGPDSEDG